MAFPTYTHAVASNAANTTTHNWTLPSGNASGKLLILAIGVDGSPTISGLTGFTQAVRESTSGHTIEVWYKFTDGSESTGTFTTSASEKSVVHSVLLTGAHASTVPEVAVLTETASTIADPPSLNPSGWGSEDTKWLVFAACSDGASESVNWTDITSYTAIDDTQTGTTSTDIQSKIWHRDNATSSEDPGTFDTDAGAIVSMATIGVRPAGGAVSVPDLTPDGIIPSVQFATQMRRHRVGKGGTHHDLFEPFYTEAESVTTDKFAPVYETVMRKIARRPPGWFAYTEVPVPADVVEHGWEFAMPQIQRRWRDRSARLSAAFLVPQSQDPLTISYQTIIGRTRIEPTYKGLSGIHPTYEGESGTNVEGE